MVATKLRSKQESMQPDRIASSSKSPSPRSRSNNNKNVKVQPAEEDETREEVMDFATLEPYQRAALLNNLQDDSSFEERVPALLESDEGSAENVESPSEEQSSSSCSTEAPAEEAKIDKISVIESVPVITPSNSTASSRSFIMERDLEAGTNPVLLPPPVPGHEVKLFSLSSSTSEEDSLDHESESDVISSSSESHPDDEIDGLVADKKITETKKETSDKEDADDLSTLTGGSIAFTHEEEMERVPQEENKTKKRRRRSFLGFRRGRRHSKGNHDDFHSTGSCSTSSRASFESFQSSDGSLSVIRKSRSFRSSEKSMGAASSKRSIRNILGGRKKKRKEAKSKKKRWFSRSKKEKSEEPQNVSNVKEEPLAKKKGAEPIIEDKNMFDFIINSMIEFTNDVVGSCNQCMIEDPVNANPS